MDVQLVSDHFIYPMLTVLRMASPIVAAFAVSVALMAFIFGRESLKEKFANLGVYVIFRLITTNLGKIILFGTLFFVYEYRVMTLPITLPWFFISLLVMDFIYYWMHRAEHRVRLLWCAHAVHHSSEEFNLTTALRLQWVWDLYQWLFLAPAVLLGFHPLFIIASKAIVLLYQFWIHTEKIGKLGWFDKVFNSPSNHRVHHGSNRAYLDKNYGGVLMLWDHAFGSYAEEQAKVNYGLTKPIKTRNPFSINTIEWSRMFADMASMQTYQNKLLVALKGPDFPSRLRRRQKAMQAHTKPTVAS